jgi:response regulator of citrate/malate metabolism
MWKKSIRVKIITKSKATKAKTIRTRLPKYPISTLLSPLSINQVENNLSKAYKRNQKQLLPSTYTLKRNVCKIVTHKSSRPSFISTTKASLPNWYKPDLTCKFYTENLGYNIDTYSSFNRKLLKLFIA